MADSDYITRKEFEEYKKNLESPPKKERKPREPSGYNLFMGSQIRKIREMNPKLSNKEAFTLAVSEWNLSKKRLGQSD